MIATFRLMWLEVSSVLKPPYPFSSTTAGCSAMQINALPLLEVCVSCTLSAEEDVKCLWCSGWLARNLLPVSVTAKTTLLSLCSTKYSIF